LEEFEIDFESGYSCSCIDSKGSPKKLYSSYEKAERAKGNKSWLKIYPCPEKIGFHLSSS
jgi:hypothetical protein